MLTTAEDEPPAFARYRSMPRANLLQYSGLQCLKQRLNGQAVAPCSFLDSFRGRTVTNADWYDRLKQSPQRAGRSNRRGNKKLLSEIPRT
jgi:hypothetical protein